NRWAARCDHAVEQSPAREATHAVRLDRMRREGVAGEGGAIDDQHLEAFAGKQQSRGRAGAAPPDDDDVEVVGAHGCLRASGGLVADIRQQLVDALAEFGWLASAAVLVGTIPQEPPRSRSN